MEEPVAQLMASTAIAAMAMEFVAPSQIAPGRWRGCPPLAANMWDTYSRLFATPIVNHILNEPGDGDEIPSDL